jgi:nucleotide-binding universal stress UspA family protein
MTTHTIACVDGSPLTQSVCEYAAWSAQRLGNTLGLLNVLDDVRRPSEVDFSGNIGVDTRQNLLLELAEIEEKRAKLARRQGLMVLDSAQRHIQTAFPHGLETVTRQRHGDLVDTLLEIEDKTRLLVIGKQGRHGDGVGQHIGHQVERVIRAVSRPVWVITGKFKAPERIMIAFDNSDTSRKAIEMVAESPLFKGIPVHVVMVAAESKEHEEQLGWANERLSASGFDVTTRLISGDVEKTLLNYASEHQMGAMVMGAYGHSRIREFFVGSHTNRLLTTTNIPLLLLR